MRRLYSIFAFALAIGTIWMPINKAQAQCDHSTRKTKGNFLGSVRLGLTPVLVNENTALAVFGEVGPRNYRVNGTLGYSCSNNHRFKIGAEYLGQKLHYNFSTGRTREWVHQYALGGKYQYWLPCGCEYVRGIQLSGNYSRSKDRHLRHVVCHEDNHRVFRHIAGSWGMNVEGGLILTPWQCSTLIVSAGYNQVCYRRHFSGHKRLDSASLGIDFNQKLNRDFEFDFQGEFNKAYNWTEAVISWNRRFECGDLRLGVFGGYVWGKDRLPCVSNAGVEMRFAFGVDSSRFSSCCCDASCNNACGCDYRDLAAWVTEPAVYIPVVLAEPDEGQCGFPVVERIVIPAISPGPFEFNIAKFFKNPEGRDLTFSAQNLPEGFKLSSSGILTGSNNGIVPPHTVEVIFTATNNCGSTSSVGAVTFICGP